MATPPLLDVEMLIRPIPGEDPAGVPLSFDLRTQLEDKRKEVDPADFDANDPTRPAQPTKADWEGIAKITLQELGQHSKSLALAARLTEAMTKLHGFAGIRDGLHLLRMLVEQCWDRLTPPLSDEDALEVRAGPLTWLGEADRGARFPSSLRLVPLLAGPEDQSSWQAWKQSQDKRGAITMEGFEKAIQATPLEQCKTNAETLTQGVAEMALFEKALSAKMGSSAPNIGDLKRALLDCQLLSQQILTRRAPAAAPPPAADAPAAVAGTSTAAPPPPTARLTRADVFRRLREAADQLQELEPHSPIPYLVRRAVTLGALPFPQLIRELVRDQKIVQDLGREFGLPEPEKEKK